ncbi:general secretion pathway protein GspD [Malaciobacter mytili LMG 24559]|uniref:General secretion pathway protein GspD n=1 Tax=Malaciobacter mytili LMG 24559 TaxID=1032238 RepID=A0AAX2ACU5_9BACT|nr:general secretion pathway protein GspD [Malaciobacter mytili]AXH15581.1 type II secretion/transformation system, D protein [Malaciobacter mytili LMG 24559]RXK12954.1 general secretion pathway protein GspD [Malaciobacter mytili LMG 24559]
MGKFIFILIFLTSFIYASSKVNFRNLQLKEFIYICSKILNKNILLNSQIEGEIDFISNKELTKEELFELLKYTLKTNGYSLVDKNGILYIEKYKKKDEIGYKYLVLKSSDINNYYKKIKQIQEKFYKNLTITKFNSSNSLLILGEVNELKEFSSYIKNLDIKEEKNITEIISLKNIEVKILNSIIEKFIKEKHIENIFFSMEVESNSFILSGKDSSLKIIKELIQKLDKNEPQVYLKAKIVELNSNLVNEVGIRYNLISAKTTNAGIYSLVASLNKIEAIPFDIKKIGLTLPTLNSSLALGATLSLLHQNYALDIVSEPSILSLNNQTSSIYIGESISLKTSSQTTTGGNTSYSYERKDVGLKLEVKPRVANDNKIRLKINTILENVKNTITNNQPDTTKKSITSTVIVSNGESVILGGLIENKKEKIDESIPFFSLLPILGEFFKYKNSKNIKKNLVVIITPYIVPKDKDLTYLRNELSKLEELENDYLEKKLKMQKTNKYKQEHKKMVKEMFNL